jgi:catechol 2,3-dioxygenase-like lactoylglutathione lyase family enzyme
MKVMSVSAVTITSLHPKRLADFYQRCLGIPLELSSHGPTEQHFEGWLGEPSRGGVHFAVLEGASGHPEAGGPAPTFRVRELEACIAELEAEGVRLTRPVAALGGGKRIACFRDWDGNMFSLIDLGF